MTAQAPMASAQAASNPGSSARRSVLIIETPLRIIAAGCCPRVSWRPSALTPRAFRKDTAVSASFDRREFLATGAGALGVALAGSSDASAQTARRKVDEPKKARSLPPLRPQQNRFRDVCDLSGLWQFQMDPDGVGEANAWHTSLPKARLIPVPCSWNDLFDDAREYLGTAWYLTECHVPSGWSGRRVCLRVGSANYRARVWVNGTLAG